ncbi:hypothetical protein JKP88DRAFT_240966 [Tribonema minus]|uniref:Ankyrin repeat domain-containing protein n=1 Tax=Tribonema minus TaxID=303371 RepID=A0A835ZA53_9STRA|nr:hypothetical protein JKP88DRAFT_255958 [Tribonema minus]KAG5186364.1 hypothetical protein JKP88DRAFT_240965 [Tribonema minus]KAG5186365.1 hypothetical protein JKP88DRAFT_240966 [Tribonema minus]
MTCTFSKRRTPYIVEPEKCELEADTVVFVHQEFYPAFDPEESGFGTLIQRRKSIAAQEQLHLAVLRYDLLNAKRLLRIFYRFGRARDLFPAVFQLIKMGKRFRPFLRDILLGIGMDESIALCALGTPESALETGIMCANSFLVKLAIDAGADVNKPNRFGVVPLRNARRLGEEDGLVDYAEALIQAGASL